MQSITSFLPSVNNTSQFSNIQTTCTENHNILWGKYGDVHQKHKIVKDYIKSKCSNLKRMFVVFIEELVNHSNWEGVSRISQRKLAELLTCSERTIRNFFILAEKLGIITKKKNGWQESNTTVLLPINSKLNNKAENFSAYLNTSYPIDHKNTLDHYEEYVSLHTKDKEKDTKPEQTPIKHPPNKPESKRMLKSEWEANQEKLPEAITQVVHEEIPSHLTQTAILTLKRLQAPDKTKLQLIREVAGCTKQFIVNNIGGLLVSRFKKLNQTCEGEKMKNRDWNAEQSLRDKALAMAQKIAAQRGMVDPATKLNCTFDEFQEYSSRMSTLYAQCLQKLDEQIRAKNNAHQKNSSCSEIPKTWADKAYS